jgi:hypothetical protein
MKTTWTDLLRFVRKTIGPKAELPQADQGQNPRCTSNERWLMLLSEVADAAPDTPPRWPCRTTAARADP